MDKIIKVDKNNMYMVIEPYVNFASCQAEAMKVGCTFPSPPAGAQVSALANIQWHGAYGNSWLSALGAHQLLSFEVVLPNGEILRSGSIAQAGSDDWIWNTVRALICADSSVVPSSAMPAAWEWSPKFPRACSPGLVRWCSRLRETQLTRNPSSRWIKSGGI